MNNEFEFTMNTDEQVTKNKFPILVQLGVLSIIMVALFSTVILKQIKLNLENQTGTTITTDNNKHQIIIPQKIEGVSVRASAAYVWDVNTQRVLYDKNAEKELPLASITKLMTTLLAYELVSEDKQNTVPLSAVQQEGNDGLTAGEKLNTRELTRLALISSSNEAAFALAASVGTSLGDNDPSTQFVQGMNIRAKELNLLTLNFKNATGLDISTTEPGAIGSARDVSFLMEYIIKNYPEIIESTQNSSARIYNTEGAYHDVDNTNEIAHKIPNLIGSKTGYTDLAGGNLTVAFDAGLNRPIIITVLGSTKEERFSDVLTLIKAVQETLGQPQE